MRKVVKACGPGATVILLSLLCNIYRDHGYYLGWDKDMPFLIADEVGVPTEEVRQVLAFAAGERSHGERKNGAQADEVCQFHPAKE